MMAAIEDYTVYVFNPVCFFVKKVLRLSLILGADV